MTTLALIFAVARNGVIGKDNDLPWRLPEDMRHFKAVTMGKPIVMGRKTYDSIGRPLPGRSNIVVTRNASFQAEGVSVVSSLNDAVELAERISKGDGVDEVVIMGGAEIYAAALPLSDRLYATEVHADVEGDTLLPAVDWTQWREISRKRHNARSPNPYDYSFVRFDRIDS
ncbi:MAG: dihydrofolate reductase [Halioglobus sp.]|nr:dihydrofolate reductase [Halioglobus sp.]